ncbi:MAG: DNA replication/repair protein RecF [Gemmatimonadetes bacterium]|nr:DNA replication/repair protein RecF [Gemmatimonadota bacterium]
MSAGSVRLLSLHLRNFRNFEDQRLDIPPGGLALVGDNGQGKTNLLEAIYYLQIFRSFRGAADEQLVRFGEDVFRVAGRLHSSGGEREVTAAYDRRARIKKVTIDGQEPRRLGEGIGNVPAVIFSPSDVAIVSGSPSERRRYLDILLSLAVPGYLQALQRYRQVLTRRNALLRAGAPSAEVTAWNHGLVSTGARVVAPRSVWVREHAAAFSERVASISGGSAGQVEYESSVELPADPIDSHNVSAVEAAFHEQLERAGEREQRRGMTLVGPHRDDLRIRGERENTPGEWVDLRTYGSGGQQRTAAVALRMIEAETLKSASGEEPVILLDDVFAELDPGRSTRILAWVREEEGGQVILTAPKPSDLERRGIGVVPWSIRSGVVSPL